MFVLLFDLSQRYALRPAQRDIGWTFIFERRNGRLNTLHKERGNKGNAVDVAEKIWLINDKVNCILQAILGTK